MFGPSSDLWVAITIALSIAAMATDLVFGRVFNWLTIPAFAAGLGLSAWSGGEAGLAQAVLGAGLGFLLYGWMYFLGVMGGGDVKLLMALGALGGTRFCLAVGLLAILIGGILAFAILASRGRIKDFLRRVREFLQGALIAKWTGFKAEPFEMDRSSTMPFAVPIGVAAILVSAGRFYGSSLVEKLF